MTFGFSFGTVPPPPIPIIDGPFTYSSNGVTHVYVWDFQCIGDEYRVFDGITQLGDTSDVTTE
jgi:hypothetical protein